MRDRIQDTIIEFTMAYGMTPTHLLLSPKSHAQLKAELDTSFKVEEVSGLKVLIVSDNTIIAKAALL